MVPVAKAIRIVGSAASGILLFVGVTEGSSVAGTVVDTTGVLEAVGVGNGVEEGSLAETIVGVGDIAVTGFCAVGGLEFAVEGLHAANINNPADAMTKDFNPLRNCFFILNTLKKFAGKLFPREFLFLCNLTPNVNLSNIKQQTRILS